MRSEVIFENKDKNNINLENNSDNNHNNETQNNTNNSYHQISQNNATSSTSSNTHIKYDSNQILTTTMSSSSYSLKKEKKSTDFETKKSDAQEFGTFSFSSQNIPNTKSQHIDIKRKLNTSDNNILEEMGKSRTKLDNPFHTFISSGQPGQIKKDTIQSMNSSNIKKKLKSNKNGGIGSGKFVR